MRKQRKRNPDRGRAVARIVPAVNRRQEEIDCAITGIMARRKQNGKITFEELRSARDEGRKSSASDK